MGKEELTHEKKEKLILEYNERVTHWTDFSLNQMSFLNNLIITLSVGFLTFSYKNICICSCLSKLSLLLILVSLFCGISGALSRLLDFRATRKINLIRLRMIEQESQLMSEDLPKKYGFLKCLPLPFRILLSEEKNVGSINFSDDNVETVKSKFKYIREIAHNLGKTSWIYISMQLFTFLLGVVCYVKFLF